MLLAGGGPKLCMYSAAAASLAPLPPGYKPRPWLPSYLLLPTASSPPQPPPVVSSSPQLLPN